VRPQHRNRWRDKAIHVQPPLIDTKMLMLFANTFQSSYYEHLMGSSAQHFHEVVRIAERIQQRWEMNMRWLSIGKPWLCVKSRRSINYSNSSINDHIITRSSSIRDNKTWMIAGEVDLECHIIMEFWCHVFYFVITSHHSMKYIFSLSLCCFEMKRCLTFYFW
jgi:hypothetical protein